MPNPKSRRAVARALLTALLAAVTGTALPASAQTADPATGRTVIADGHVDIGPRFLDGTWTVQVRDDTVQPPVWRDVKDVVLHAVDAAKVEVPGGDRFSFLGAPGKPVWVLPQVQRPGVLWPGWNTQAPRVSSTVSRQVTWRLRGVTGPGRFVLFVNGDFGTPQVLFDSTRAHPQQTSVDLNTHAHGNWAFTAPGTYLLDIEMGARTADGGRVGDRRLLRVFVGAGAPDAAFDVPAPAGFIPGGTTGATADEASGEGFPMWGLVLAGAGGAAALVIVTATVTARRSSRRAAAAPGRES